MRRIICDPAICYGAPCLEGTRIAVWFLRGTLAEVHDAYPDLALTDDEHAMIAAWCSTPTGQAYLSTTAPGELPEETEALLSRLPAGPDASAIAAVLRALTARVEQIEEEITAGWIVASDPPASADDVLTIDAAGVVRVAHYHGDEWRTSTRALAVRYWRPLPEPPTGAR